MDRLAKVGPSLAKLCTGPESGQLLVRLDNVQDRYQRLRDSVRSQSDQLKEKDVQAQKVSICSYC